METSSPTKTEPPVRVRAEMPSILGGRYVLTRTLKTGRGVVTWLAHDLVESRDVVVKGSTVQATSEGTELLLRHEASVLASLDHPHLAPLLDVGIDQGMLFLAVPHVEGITLRERLARGPLDVDNALTLAEALASALQAVAERGVLHRDLKPENVMVSRGSALRDVTLVDFGFSRSDLLEPSLHDLPLGTARYSAPEQTGLVDGEVDERSDLYALGAVLFEALAGRPPYQGATLGAVLRQHLLEPVPSLRALGVAVPRAFDEIVQRLLAKDPRDRYQTAGALGIDLAAVRDAVAAGEPDRPIVIGTHDRRCCTIGHPAFVGRRDELASLTSALDEAAAGRPALVWLGAESGGGKTRLLEEFAQRAAEQGAWVLRGQAVDQAAVLPFQTLHAVGDALARDDHPERRGQVAAALGPHAAAAAAALPQLATLLPARDDEMLGPEEHGEARSIAALATLLDALGATDQPAVLLIDDGQWADRLTCRVLAQWRRSADGGARRRVLVVVASRSDEVGPGNPLREASFDRRIELPPLDDGDLRQLVESSTGEIERRAADTVVELADGSPFMASAVLHGLVEVGALACRHPGWHLVHDDDELFQSSRRAGAFLARRLDLLPEATLGLLVAGAVLGKQFDLELAAHLAHQPPTTAVLARHDASRRRLVWSRRGGSTCSFVHDKIREALLARLDPAERRDLHARAATRLEATGPERSFELAYHFDAAGQPERALPFALAAAVEARSRYSLDVAEQQYRIASRGFDGADAATRLAVTTGLGEVLMLAGRYDEARHALEAALELAGDPLVEADLYGTLAELAFKEGRLDDAAVATEQGVRLLGDRFPRRFVGFVVEVLREIAVQALHTIAPRLFVARRPLGPKARRDLLAARLYSRYAHVAWFSRGPVQTLWTHLREMNLAERYPPTPELAQAYSEHAPVATLVGWHARGVRYARRSLDIRRGLRDVWGQGQSLSFYGIVLYTAGRFGESIEACREAVQLLGRTGDRWELNIARCHVAYNLYRTGRWAEAVELARDVHRDGVEIGDRQAAGVSLDVWAKAGGGAVSADLVAGELEHATPDVQLVSHRLQAESLRLRRAGRHSDAVEVLDRAVSAADSAGIRNEYVAAARPWLATVLREMAEDLPSYSSRRQATIRRARKAARRARRLALLFPNNRPHALRETGLVAAVSGRHRTARRMLQRSLAAAVASASAQEEYDTLRWIERVGADRGWRETAQASERLGALAPLFADAPGVGRVDSEPVTLGLLDRFDLLLDEGRRIAGGLSESTVYATAAAAMRNLLRAQRCTVVDLQGDPIGPDTSEPDGAVTAWLVEAALARRRPVVLGDESGEAGEFDWVDVRGTRSGICAPVFVRGEPAACLVATHGSVEGLFAEDEVRLAEFVAAIAGAALENAHGFAEIEALQRSLEERVAERTAQLSTMLEELERVNAELRDADLMKNDFVSMVSHELRTPLTPIIGLSSTMLQRWGTMEDDLRKECLVSIHRQGSRLARLVDDLLEMSRIESGAIEANPSVVEVATMLASTVAGLGPEFSDVDMTCPPGLAVVADADRVQQILINYLENARKYGGGPITVEAGAAGRWVEITVADAGDGVPEAFVGRLFEKFSRAVGTDAAGTGLGLSIVRGLARAQGGDAWYAPNEPHGSRFSVRLPRARAA